MMGLAQKEVEITFHVAACRLTIFAEAPLLGTVANDQIKQLVFVIARQGQAVTILALRGVTILGAARAIGVFAADNNPAIHILTCPCTGAKAQCQGRDQSVFLVVILHLVAS